MTPRVLPEWLLYESRGKLVVLYWDCNVFWFLNRSSCIIEGILPEGPYPPCLRMADRALLAGYPRFMVTVSTLLVTGKGNPPAIAESHRKGRLMRSFSPNKLSNKRPSCRWFQTLWPHFTNMSMNGWYLPTHICRWFGDCRWLITTSRDVQFLIQNVNLCRLTKCMISAEYRNVFGRFSTSRQLQECLSPFNSLTTYYTRSPH